MATLYSCFDFNPRSPHGERRAAVKRFCCNGGYFNPRSPHGERLSSHALRPYHANFNPRSPHGERLDCQAFVEYCVNFNPRSPHGERLWGARWTSCRRIFQSTLPARGATFIGYHLQDTMYYFNPRSPHGERHDGSARYWCPLPISIHAPRTGSDQMRTQSRTGYLKFQSTLPARGATRCYQISRVRS